MTWDVPVKDDCPACGKTMFKRAGRGYKRPFCINPECSKFLPEDKRGYYKKPDETAENEEKKPAKRTTAKKTAAKKTSTKKTTTRKTKKEEA